MNFLSLVQGVRMAELKDFRRVTHLAATLMREHLKPGDFAVDATAGNGEDTCMMAEAVGEDGRIYAFDIQKKAIERTQTLLLSKGYEKRVVLYEKGHETMAEIPEIAEKPGLSGVMFNLGYLPGDEGERRIHTKKETTIIAIQSALHLLLPGGLMTICIYPHPEGQCEGEAIEKLLKSVSGGLYVHKIKTINRNNPPWLLIVERAK